MRKSPSVSCYYCKILLRDIFLFLKIMAQILQCKNQWDHTALLGQLASGLGCRKIIRTFLLSILDVDKFLACLLKPPDMTWCKFVLKLSKVHHLNFKWTSSFPQSGTTCQSESLENVASLGWPHHLPRLQPCADILDDFHHLVSVREAASPELWVNQLVLDLHLKCSPPSNFSLHHCIYNPVISLGSSLYLITYWELSPVWGTEGPSYGWRSLRSHSILYGLKSTSFLLIQLVSPL